jgi:PhnB protein
MQVQPYLFFEGRCEEAVNFYVKTLGAKVETLMRYKDSPEPSQSGMVPPNSDNKIMHGSMKIGETTVMVSDGHCSGKASFQGFALCVYAANEADAKKKFAALDEGGQVRMPLSKTFFSPSFGMVTDRFGVLWMLIVMP